MTRTIVDIPAAQLAEIDRLCKPMGISRAEAVRRALVAFADGHAAVTPEAFGLWSTARATAAARPAAASVAARDPRRARDGAAR